MRSLPEAKIFLEWFQEQARILVESSELLLEGVRAGADRSGVMLTRIGQLEGEADEVVHKVATALNRTFIRAYEPEDIQALASGLDDIIDGLEEVAHRISAYRVSPIPPVVVQLAEILEESAHAVQRAVGALAGRDHAAVLARCAEIDRLESKSDVLMRQAVARLFPATNNAIDLIKLKEIYELLEDATDRCEDVADTLRSVVVKES
jgi:predicted phosphate transport protein (TIGR00153 family)